MFSKRRLLLAALLVFAGGGALAGYYFFGKPKVTVGGPVASMELVSFAKIDHQDYDRLLHRYVNDQGLVAYGKWKATSDDLRSLDAYLNHLGAADPKCASSKEEELAFWINAYNALTLKGILEKYPTNSIKNFTNVVGYNIWNDLLLWVGDQNYSLNHIEHKILRKLDEPRIHFAIVCASRSCPPLRNEAYTGAKLEQQLADNSRRFFARSSNFAADADSQTLELSAILQWFGSDFGETQAQRIHRIRPYFPQPESMAWTEASQVIITYQDYDWGINDQQPSAP